ncbi:hypothetical protein CL620_04960 [archaeon]|jgi:recombination protein RecA|nr:hypothetical protein [archaeon]
MLIIDKRRGDSAPEKEIIPTPSMGLNRALGGGFYTGATHLLWGSPSAGKTTMAYHIMAKAQKMGYRPVIVDSEYSYNDSYAEKCGIDISDIVLIQGTIVEDIIKALIGYLEHPVEKHIFLFDSLSNIIKEEFYLKPEGGKAMGLQARSQGYFLQKLVHHLHKERNIMLFIAHQTVDLSGMYAQLKARMGNAVHHNMHSIIRLFLSYSAKEMERDDSKMITSQKVVWTIDKTKQVPSIGSSGHYFILPQAGQIDENREIIDMAVERNIIERRGAWFSFEESKWNGIGAIELSGDERIKIEALLDA